MLMRGSALYPVSYDHLPRYGFMSTDCSFLFTRMVMTGYYTCLEKA